MPLRHKSLLSLMDDTHVEALRPETEPRLPQRNRLKKLAAILVASFAALLLSAAFFKPYVDLYPIYWVHDRVWLPLKGHTFTRFYPTSWIWWGTAALLGLLALVECFLNCFPLRRTQIWFLRLILRNQNPESRWMLHFLVLKATSWCLTALCVSVRRTTEAVQRRRRRKDGEP